MLEVEWDEFKWDLKVSGVGDGKDIIYGYKSHFEVCCYLYAR